MSIAPELIEIREIFNNSREEQRIAFLEVLSDMLKGIIDITKKPRLTPEGITFKPIMDSATQEIVSGIQWLTPEQLQGFLKLFPYEPRPGKKVTIVGIRKDRTRLSKELRDFYKIIGTKEEDDIYVNKKIFLQVLSQYGFIERQEIETQPIYKLIMEHAEQIFIIDTDGNMRLKKIEDISDDSFKEFYNFARGLFTEDFIQRSLEDDWNIETGNYFIIEEQIHQLYEFLKGWNWILDYSSHFDSKTWEVTYQGEIIPYFKGDNPYLVLQYLYDSPKEKWIDLEDVYNKMQLQSRWNRRYEYEQWWKEQIENVIKTINRGFKKKIPNQRLVTVLGIKAILLV